MDMILGRTRYFFKEKYNLIKSYYEQLQEKRPRYSIKQAFPQISQLFNNIINRKYQEMTAEEMIDTLTEINRRISENKIYIDSNGDKNLYYLTRDELLYFVNIIEDLLKKQRAQEDTVDTTPSQQKSIRSKTYGTQEQTETPIQQKSTISSDSTGHSDMIIGTSRYVYKQKYDLIKNYYERFQENTSQYSIKQAFSQISQLLNDLINKDDRVMNYQEMTSTFLELNRRIIAKEYYIETNGTKNKYYLTNDELFYLLTIATDFAEESRDDRHNRFKHVQYTRKLKNNGYIYTTVHRFKYIEQAEKVRNDKHNTDAHHTTVRHFRHNTKHYESAVRDNRNEKFFTEQYSTAIRDEN